MEPRLASSVLVSALIRLAEGQGGFGAVLASGDATSGAIAVILLERGVTSRLFERLLQPDGCYSWAESTPAAEGETGVQRLLERRRRFDPDLWIIELDIASAERFAAEMNGLG
ncbi:MAG TPA: DUF1491 family protein [Allosphingosinicella sp.]|jgi:hypothetical protein